MRLSDNYQKGDRPGQVGFVALVFGLILIALPAATSASFGNALFLDRPPNGSMTLEIIHPHIPGGYLSMSSTGIFATLRVPTSNEARFVLEVPLASMSYNRGMEDTYGYLSYYSPLGEEGSSIGNLYVGFEMGKETGPFGEVGVRLPTMPEDNDAGAFVGTVADLDRFGSFENCLGFAVSAIVGHRSLSASGMETMVAGAPVLVTAASGCGGGGDIGFQYAGSIGAVTSEVAIRAGLTGFMAITVSDADFGERTYHNFRFTATYRKTAVRPGVSFQIRLDDVPAYSGQDYALGLNLVYPFK